MGTSTLAVSPPHWFDPRRAAPPRTGPHVLLSDVIAGDSLLTPTVLSGAPLGLHKAYPFPSLQLQPTTVLAPMRQASSICWNRMAVGSGSTVLRAPSGLRHWLRRFTPGIRALGLHKVPSERMLRFSVVAPLWARPLFWVALAVAGVVLLAIAAYAFHQARVARAVEA
jgi:hypothetical protein